MTRGYLLVRAEGRPYGLPLAGVLEVSDLDAVHDAPRSLAAVRGLVTLRGRLVPLVHLGALLGGRLAPAEQGRTAVLVRLEDATQVALEVDDAHAVIREDPLPVPEGEHLPWATGVATVPEHGLVPILDLVALEDRIR